MSTKVTLSQTSGHGPCLATFNNELVLGWAEKSSDYINVASSTDGGQTWGAPLISAQTTRATPAIAEFAGLAYLAWAGTDSGNHLNLMQSSDLAVFRDQVTSQEELAAGTGPALAVFNNALYVAWTSSSSELMIGQIIDGAITDIVGLSQASSTSPALAADDSFLCIAWAGTNYKEGTTSAIGTRDTSPQEPNLIVMRSSNGYSFSGPVTLSETSLHTCQPALTESGGKLILGWTGGDSNRSLNTMYSSDQGQTFTGKQTDTSNSSNWGPALYSSYIAWTGTDNRLNIQQGV